MKLSKPHFWNYSKENDITFSIITVSFNAFNEIEDTIKSVCNQTFRKFEYIVIDGGSFDGTCDIIEKYSNEISIYISEKDDGIYDAMNKGISLSRGKFLIFMNAGDRFFDCTILSKIVEIESLEQYSLIYGDYYREDHTALVYRTSRDYSTIWYGMFASHQAMFFHRQVIEPLKYDISLRIGADYDLVAKIICTKLLKIKKINVPICIFNTSGISNEDWKFALLENFKTRRSVLQLNFLFCCLVLVFHAMINLLRVNFPIIYLNFRQMQQYGGRIIKAINIKVDG